jgi:hypothetical protein
MGDDDTENMTSTVREYVATDLCETAMAREEVMPLQGLPVHCIAAQIHSGDPERQEIAEPREDTELKQAATHRKGRSQRT